MSKKRAKSGSAGVARWESGLASTPFCDDNWKANIYFLAGNKLEDNSHIDVLGTGVNAGTRRLFSFFSKDELYNQVRDLGNPKSKKSKETPANYEVCEPCKQHLDAGEDIPLPLLAKLVKFKLLACKDNDKRRRDAEKKAAAEKDKPGGKGGKGDKKDRAKSPGKKGGKKTPDPPSAKKESKLRKRGDEDLDSKYIDDEPDDGPNHYVLVHGFTEPYLITLLDELGITVEAIIKVKSQDYSQFEKPTDDQQVPPPVADEAAEEEKLQKLNAEKEKVQTFWRDILPILQKCAPQSKLHDLARLEYVVKNLIIPENMEDNEKKTEFAATLYEDIACMCYDLIDYKRQYHNYLENMKLLQVPIAVPQGGAAMAEAVSVGSGLDKSGSQEVATAATTPEADMRYYNDLMNTLPQESISVELVMHCMLEQLQATEEDRQPPSETPAPIHSDGLDSQLSSHLNQIAFKLALSSEEQQSLEPEIAVPTRTQEKLNQPKLVSANDDISIRTDHLKTVDGFNPKTAEITMLKYLPFAGMSHLPAPSSRTAKERAARLQELIHFCATGGLSQSEIDRAFKQFVFECMDLTSTDINGFIITKEGEGAHHSVIPWDDPYPFFKGMIPVSEKRKSIIAMESVSTMSSGERSGAKSPTGDLKSNSNYGSTAGSRSHSAEGSRPSTPGILRSRSCSPNRPKSRGSQASDDNISDRKISLGGTMHSVRFGNDHEGAPLEPLADSPEPDKTLEESMNEVVNAEKRNLDQWCFAEHYEPELLLQVLRKASERLPYVDTYYHKRDHTLMICLHNPHSAELQSYVDWESNLHSNVGFRNYLEHVSESISEWTTAEEAKFQAELLRRELEKLQKEEEAASSRPNSGKKSRQRSKSPKKSSSKKGSRSSSQERAETPSDPFVRANSLKALKVEQDRIRAEEEAKEREKEDKRAKSAQKKANKEALEKEKAEKEKKDKEKRPGSRGSAKSRKSSRNENKDDLDKQPEEPQEEEPYWPFHGYDVGNDLIHASGSISTLFPADGGQIRTERTDFVQGSSVVKTTVQKDGHMFCIHVVDPIEPDEDAEANEDEMIRIATPRDPTPQGEPADEVEKSELEKPEKEEEETGDPVEEVSEEAEEIIEMVPQEQPSKPCVSYFGSFSAKFEDGMVLALSTFGENGAPDIKKPEPEPYVPPNVPRSPSPGPNKDQSPTKGKRDKSREKASTPEPSLQDEEVKGDAPEEPAAPPPQGFQQLFITCPDGLHVQYGLEASYGIKSECEDGLSSIVVRQSYPLKSRGINDCEKTRRVPAMQEGSRIITKEGTIIKTMVDGTAQVLFPDGKVSSLSGFSLPKPVSRNSSPQRAGSASRSPRAEDRETPTKKASKGRKPSGKQEKEEKEEEKPGFWMTTLASGERISTKADGLTKLPAQDVPLCVATDPETRQRMITRDDRVIIVEHPDGTMIVEHSEGTRITRYYRNTEVTITAEDADETGEEPEIQTIVEKFIKVECPGYATIEFNQDTGECFTLFGSGSFIQTLPDGSYFMDYHDGGKLEISAEGTSTYIPKPNNDLVCTDVTQELVYTMRHHSEMICETIDNEKNVFGVKFNGETSVTLANDNDILSSSSDDILDIKTPPKRMVTYRQHAPRFFIMHADGSGTEMLRYQDISEYLSLAEADPNVAVLKDPLADYPGVMGITILKPAAKGISEQWLKQYDEPTIVPNGLRSRDLKSLPSKEAKKEGPEFGTTLGQGLAVGSAVKPPPLPVPPKCPQVLELRQLVQFKPVTEELRCILQDGLKEYAEFVKQRYQTSEELQVKDPRNEEERMMASDLISEALPEAKADALASDISDAYEKATAPPLPTPPPTPLPKRTQADWERDARELAEESENRNALRHHAVPSYFHSELGKAFLLTRAPDMEALMKELTDDPRIEEEAATRSDHSTPASPQPENTTSTGPSPSDTAVTGNTPSKLRPGNPTPGHAEGKGSPSPIRPNAPTPAHADAKKTVQDRPGNPTPKHAGDNNQASETPSSHYPSIPERPAEEESPDDVCDPDKTSPRVTSLEKNVIGQPRQYVVKVPAYIKAGRPGAQPNGKFAQVEDPVRRQVFTSSVAGATEKGHVLLKDLRGFELLPERVDFGILREGYTYQFPVHLKNTGVDSCRFKLKQPPPSTGLKVLYKPGAVAAGMKTTLAIEIYAIAVGVEGNSGVGGVGHDLEIITETDSLILPIAATILTAAEYDNRDPKNLQRGKKAGVQLISTKPPGGQGVIRPRKDEMICV
ncbi:sperm-associated antigen 17-like isoform X2 [Lineus longissimus]|uniref:sperm-associated antigen 17-like isoform X2 n=1 Tax=Lineus longissimus TaxID=88925 RepID=UPI00315CE5DC